LPDGSGLYLRITAAGVRSWLFRYTVNGRERYMGLGLLHAVGLAEARCRAATMRELRASGVDPIEYRRAQQQQAAQDRAKATGRCLPPDATGDYHLYRQFNAKGQLLYVGITLHENGLERLRKHARATPWFHQVTIITIEHFATHAEAVAAETAAITNELPPYNVHGGTRLKAQQARRRLQQLAASRAPVATAP
jgi:hypothetical protein